MPLQGVLTRNLMRKDEKMLIIRSCPQMTRLPRFIVAVVSLLFALTASPQSTTQVVILGTGTPILDPDRSGPAFAVVVNGAAYLVDFGPGVVRRAAAAARDKKIAALTPSNIKIA